MAKIVFSVDNDGLFHLLRIEEASDLKAVRIIRAYFDACADHLAPVAKNVFGLFKADVVINETTVVDMIARPVAIYERGDTKLTAPVKADVVWLGT